MLKKTLGFIFLLPSLILGQWSYEEKNDPFEGKTKSVIARGFGGDYPYTYPTIIFELIGNKRQIYITGAGSTICDNPT